MFINNGGIWKSITDMLINVSGVWKEITAGFINVSGVWKIFFSSPLKPQYIVTIAQSTNGTTYLTTLTGTNYYWSPGPPSLTYRFQWWNGVSWSDISTASANNPAYGSSTSYTQLLQSTGPSVYVQPNQVNRFRFKVDATYGIQSTNSVSLETTIQGPTSVTLTAGTAATTSVGLSWTASTGANRYMVYYSTNNSVFTLFGGAPSTSVTVTGLTSSTLYYFKVIPITGSTNDTGYYGSYSNTVSQSTLTPQYTVTWGANGGTGGGSTGPFNAGVAHTAPSPGTRVGFTFVNYRYPASGGTDPIFVNYPGTYTPTADTTFGAIWTANTYTISYNGNGSTSGSTASGSYTTGGSAYTIAANGFTRTGYTFNGWNTAADGTGTSYTAGVSTYSTAANLILYAQWTAVQYTVTWSPNGGSVTPASSSGTYGSSVTAPTPTLTGNTFLYWRDGTTEFNYANQLSAGASWTITGSTTFYARWTAATSAPGTPVVAGDNSLSVGGTFTWSCTGSPAPVYRVTIGYNATVSSGTFTTAYQYPVATLTTSNGVSLTSIRPGYDPGGGGSWSSDGVSGHTSPMWKGSGYYRCTIQAINSAGGPTSGSATVFMS